MITVLLVDDHDYVLTSLRYLLDIREDIKVIGTAPNGIEAVSQASSHYPEVVVMDLAMPLMDGIEATRQIHERYPHIRVVIISIYSHPVHIRQALNVGASGYVLKDQLVLDIIPAIRALSQGEKYFSEGIADVAEEYLHQNYQQ